MVRPRKTYHCVIGPLLDQRVVEHLPQVRILVPRQPREVIHQRHVVKVEEGMHRVQPVGQNAYIAVPEFAYEHEVVLAELLEGFGPLVDEVP